MLVATLLLVVAGFGLATIVFGLSHSFALSRLMLFLLGALDNISVVIRSTLYLNYHENSKRSGSEPRDTIHTALRFSFLCDMDR